MERMITVFYKPVTLNGQTTQRPPFETPERNRMNQERIHSHSIDRIESGTLKECLEREKKSRKFENIQLSKKSISIIGPDDITPVVLIQKLRSLGKTDLSISKYLEMSVEQVKLIK